MQFWCDGLICSARSLTAKHTWWLRRTFQCYIRQSCAKSTVPMGTVPMASDASSFTTSPRPIRPLSSRSSASSKVRLWSRHSRLLQPSSQLRKCNSYRLPLMCPNHNSSQRSPHFSSMLPISSPSFPLWRSLMSRSQPRLWRRNQNQLASWLSMSTDSSLL